MVQQALVWSRRGLRAAATLRPDIRALKAEREGFAAAYLAICAERDAARAEAGALRAERDGFEAAYLAVSAERDGARADAARHGAERDGYARAFEAASAGAAAQREEAERLNTPLDPVAPEVEARVPGVVVVTLPKSGTVYVQQKLLRSFGLARRHACTGRFPCDRLDPVALGVVARGGRLAMSHADAGAENVAALAGAGLRFIVHLRDPRAAMLSMLHHIRAYHADPALRPFLGRIGIPFPAGFHAAPFGAQLDAMIERYLPASVTWIEGWLAAFEHDPGVRALGRLTCFDDFALEEDAFLRTVSAHLGLPLDGSRFAEVTRDAAAHFRTGDDGEWARTLTPTQRGRAARAVPGALRDRFGWP